MVVAVAHTTVLHPPAHFIMKAVHSRGGGGGGGNPSFLRGAGGVGGGLTPMKPMHSTRAGKKAPFDKVTIESFSLFCFFFFLFHTPPTNQRSTKCHIGKPEPIHSPHSSHSISSHRLSTSPFTPRIASSPRRGPRVPRVCSARRKEVQEAKRVRGERKGPEGCSAD